MSESRDGTRPKGGVTRSQNSAADPGQAAAPDDRWQTHEAVGSWAARPLATQSLATQSYDDPAMMDRVWERLEVSRARASGRSWLVRGITSAALVAAGVLLGMVIQARRTPFLSASADPLYLPAGAVSVVEEGSAVRARLAKRSERGAIESTPTSSSPKSPARARALRRALDLSKLGRSRRAVAKEDSSEDPELIEEQPIEVVVEVEPPSPVVRPMWLQLADRGDFAGSFQKLDETDGFARVLESGSADELMTLADVARAMGRQGQAILSLRAVTEHHQADPNAPLAAMMLGNLLRRAGDAAGAAAAFALNRQLSPAGDFAEDALVRQFDMALAAEDLEQVLELQARYQEDFPQGRHLEEMKSDTTVLAEALVAKSLSDEKQGEADAEPRSTRRQNASRQDPDDEPPLAKSNPSVAPAQPNEATAERRSPSSGSSSPSD